MKRKYFISLILLLITMNLHSQAHLTQAIDSHLSALKQQYAPDKRTAVFNYTLENSGSGETVLKGETTVPEIKSGIDGFLAEKKYPVKNEISLLPDATTKGKKYAVVTLSVVNIRKGWDHPEEMLTQSIMGTVLRVYKYKEGFYYVQTPDNYLGWTESDGLQLMDNDAVNKYVAAAKIIVTAFTAACYSEPSVKSIPVSDLVAGNLLCLKSQNGSYYNVELPDGRKGFIKKTDASPFVSWCKSLKAGPQDIIATAKRFLGVPYLWGGTSAKGVDCSGFTKSVYFLNGFILPRDASQQVHVGDLIDTVLELKSLKPADVVFFGKRDPVKGERATHVGIYCGNGDFIHSSGRVRLNSFLESSEIFNEYRTNMFLRAKRMLGSKDARIVKITESKYYFPIEVLK